MSQPQKHKSRLKNSDYDTPLPHEPSDTQGPGGAVPLMSVGLAVARSSRGMASSSFFSKSRKALTLPATASSVAKMNAFSSCSPVPYTPSTIVAKTFLTVTRPLWRNYSTPSSVFCCENDSLSSALYGENDSHCQPSSVAKVLHTFNLQSSVTEMNAFPSCSQTRVTTSTISAPTRFPIPSHPLRRGVPLAPDRKLDGLYSGIRCSAC